jgi:hypothetical protein
VVDVKIFRKSAIDCALLLRGTTLSLADLMPRGGGPLEKDPIVKMGAWNRVSVTIKGREVILKINDQEIRRQQLPADAPERGAIGLVDLGSEAEFANLLVRDL